MNIDRRAFLAFAAVIAGASAACSAAPDGAVAGDQSDFTSSTEGGPAAEGGPAVEGGPAAEGGACFSDGDAAFPYQEGTCSALYLKATEDDYRSFTATLEGGGTLAQSMGCTPESPTHPAAEGAKLCPKYAADFTYGRCRAFATTYKSSSAAAALACLQRVQNFSDSMAVYDCGYAALDRACSFHPTAESTCADIATALEARGKSLSAAERGECMTKVSGVRAGGRQQLVDRATAGAWYGMHSAIEGLAGTAPGK